MPSIWTRLKINHFYHGKELTLPVDKSSDSSKLKAFTVRQTKHFKIVKFIVERLKIIVGKGENAVYQHFLLH